MNKFFNLLISVFLICLITGCSSVPQKVIFEENFDNLNNLGKRWSIINGSWIINESTIEVRSNEDWAVLLSNKKLPDNYILTFSILPDPNAVLFEVIANLKGEKYLGIILYEIEGNVKIEDRSLFSPENRIKQRSYIRSTGHIGMMPEVKYPMRYEWMDWKIQKIGNRLYVWIDGEDIISYIDEEGLLNLKSRFGFAAKGIFKIKNIQLSRTKDGVSLLPESFEDKPKEPREFFLFSE